MPAKPSWQEGRGRGRVVRIALRQIRCLAHRRYVVASDMRSLISIDTEEPLDQNGLRPQVTPYAFRACRPASSMSKICSITGSRVTRGSVIHRRGMAKKKGGVGRHVTKNVRREFHPNLHEHRVWVPEIKKFVRIRVTARGLKTINKNGAYRALKKAGVIAG